MSAARPPPRIMASMLTADFTILGEQCRSLAAAGVDGIHWDVMDGNAVPSLSFGPEIIAACRRAVDLPFEVHVMSRRPEPMIDALAAAGCEAMIVHPDWLQNPRRALQRICETGMAAGVALSPGTPSAFARWQLDIVDRVLVMSVEPGYGGQQHIPAMTDKIAEIAELSRRTGRPVTIAVDGGIGPTTIARPHGAGADSFVVGSALWRETDFDAAIRALHHAVERQRNQPVAQQNESVGRLI